MRDARTTSRHLVLAFRDCTHLGYSGTPFACSPRYRGGVVTGVSHPRQSSVRPCGGCPIDTPFQAARRSQSNLPKLPKGLRPFQQWQGDRRRMAHWYRGSSKSCPGRMGSLRVVYRSHRFLHWCRPGRLVASVVGPEQAAATCLGGTCAVGHGKTSVYIARPLRRFR
jgi:hypothetical protein